MKKERKNKSGKGRKKRDLADLVLKSGLTTTLPLLFSVSFIYLFIFGRGIFFFQLNRSMFVFSSEYLCRFTGIPGGLLSYFASFLTAIYVSPLSAAFLISFLLLLLALVFRILIRRQSELCSLKLLLMVLPPLLLLIAHTYIEYDLRHTAGFLLSMAWFTGMTHPRNRITRTVFTSLLPVFYYFAGTYALISVGVYITFNLVSGNGTGKYINILVISIITILTCFISAEVLFFQPLKRLAGNPLIFNDNARLTNFLIFNGILYIMYPVLIKFSGFVRSLKAEAILTAATVVIIFPAAIYTLSLLYKPETSKVLRIEEEFYNHDWDKVISMYERDPSGSILGQFFYNLALSEKGELCERMFFGNQSSGPMALSLEGNREQAFRTMHYYYSIGLVNEAHHLAYELMVQQGYTPENIKMLIKTELINGNYRVAERYLDVLGKTILYKKWTVKYREMLFNRELVQSDKELGEKIRLMPRNDFFIHTEDAKNIDLFLRSNPENKKAFEYRIARMLLEKDLLAVVEELPAMKEAGYMKIPRHIREAILIYANHTGETPDMGGLSFDRETEKRFEDYFRVVNTYRTDKNMLEKKIRKSEKNTFWYYLQFGTIKSDFLRGKPADRSIY